MMLNAKVAEPVWCWAGHLNLVKEEIVTNLEIQYRRHFPRIFVVLKLPHFKMTVMWSVIHFQCLKNKDARKAKRKIKQ